MVKSPNSIPASRTLNSEAETVVPFNTKVEEELPVRVKVSNAEPMFRVSAQVLFVPMLIVLPEAPVPILIVPVVPVSKVKAPVVPVVIESASPDGVRMSPLELIWN